MVTLRTGVLNDAANILVGQQGTGRLLLGGSSVVNTNALAIAVSNGTTGIVTQTGGTMNAPSGVTIGVNAGTSGTPAVNEIYKLYGGKLYTSSISQNSLSSVNGVFNYNGGTIVSAGTLIAAGRHTLETGAVTVNPGATLSVTNANAFATTSQPIILSGGTLAISGATINLTVTGTGAWSQFNVSGSGFIPTNAAGTITLTKSGVGNFAARNWTPVTVSDANVFSLSFTYNHSTDASAGRVAEGITFGFQNDSRGLNALTTATTA